MSQKKLRLVKNFIFSEIGLFLHDLPINNLLILVNVKDKYSFYFLANAGFFATNEYQHLSNGIVDNCF